MKDLTVKELKDILESLCKEGKGDFPITSHANNHFTRPSDKCRVGLISHHISGNKDSIMIGNLPADRTGVELQHGNATLKKIIHE